MAKLTVYHKISALVAIMLLTATCGFCQYKLEIKGIDRSPAFFHDTVKLQQHFPNQPACAAYIGKLPALLQLKGFQSASVDSIFYDSASAVCVLYVGEVFHYHSLHIDSVDQSLIENMGIGRRSRKPVNLLAFGPIQERGIGYMENTGYPFASIALDSIRFAQDSLLANLKVDKGPLYKIDSIRNLGTAYISSGFLQQYLGIKNGSIYRREKLMEISDRIRELPYLQEKQPFNLTMLGTGSILNVYLDPKKSSEINVLIGLLPANDQLVNNKLLVTGEATINLKNSLGGGETIGLNWQQLQVKSPRLDLVFQQPYIFGSPFGLNFNFDLFKKDSSYVNVSILVGAAYAVSARQTGSVFLQRLSSNLLTVDTNSIKSSRRLPAEADVSSVNLGVNYEINSTDYRFNPRRGNEFSVSASAGTKNIKKNNVIVKLTDDSDPSFDFNTLYDTFQLKSYQFRIKLAGAHYFPISRASTVRAAFSGGWFQSPDIFRNELFQIGGYKLLRGFDEESIFASAYGVATAEYRYLLGQNSFLSAFADYGKTTNGAQGTRINNSFLGAGVGMAFETKAGIFNISYAAGKRDDQKFNLRQSKIHLGYVNYF
jgi:outer membrane protein assembly factor BamA